MSYVKKQASKLAARNVGGMVNPETENSTAYAPEKETPGSIASDSNPTSKSARDPELETPATDIPRYRYVDYVGETPLIELTQLVQSFKNPNVRVFAKVEYMNPSLSIEDRVVLEVLKEAAAAGKLRQGMTVVTASCKNRAASVACICAAKKYKCIVVESCQCAKETQDCLAAYGAKVLIRSEPQDAANLLVEENSDTHFYFDHFERETKFSGHCSSLAAEIYEQSQGNVTHLIGTPSTLTTIVGEILKQQLPHLHVVIADPMNEFCSVGVSKTLINASSIDEKICVTDQQALETCHLLANTQGLCGGMLSGVNIYAALELAARLEDDAVIVTSLPDSGPKELSQVYNPVWLERNGFQIPERFELRTRNPEQRLREADEGLLPESSTSFHAASALRASARIDACMYADLVGDTPIVDLTHLVEDIGHADTRVLAKLEFFAPGFSIKDRIARWIFDKAEREGRLRPGMTVVAASSGNTGNSTALLAAARGYECIITTSPKCSDEKQNNVKAYGAKLLVSPSGVPEGDPKHYMEMARILASESPDLYFDVDQYETQANPEAHYRTLGPEIWENSYGQVTHLVVGASTGGTISGIAGFLKERNPEVKAVLADPIGSIFTGYFQNGKIGRPGKFLVEGVGKGSIPSAMNFNFIDDVIPVSDQEAFNTCFRLGREEGICAGGSSGMNLAGALKLASKLKERAVIVTTFADLGVKYLSKVYNEEWLKENGFDCPSN